MNASRRLHVPPRDPGAEPVCLLTREWAARRAESPDHFLEASLSETSTADGIEYRLPAASGMWERVAVFAQEEGECCPFLAFEAEEMGEEIILRVVWPGFEAE